MSKHRLFTDISAQLLAKTKEKYIKNQRTVLPQYLAIIDALWKNINDHSLLKNKKTADKAKLLDEMIHSKVALQQALDFLKKPKELNQWLTTQLKASTPVWDPAFNKPIRSNWALKKHAQRKDKEDEKERFAAVDICGFKVDESMPYEFETNKQTAIWFSINPDVALREKEKACLINRGTHNPFCKNRLIYSSALLTEQAKTDLASFAKKNNISLTDIDSLGEYLSPTSAKLLIRAQLELKNLNHGGNPAAASDLIRWIPELMEGSVYADIDLPLDPLTTGQPNPPQKAGLPVVLHMGSITRVIKQRSVETCTLNTDIIAYSESWRTTEFMERVGTELLNAHTNPFQALLNIKSVICDTAAFHKIQAAKGTIFDLREAINKCTNLRDFYNFLGEDLFCTSFKKALSLSPKNMDKLLYTLKYDLPLPNVVDDDVIKKMAEIKQVYYKILVEEITGPGAVYQAFGGVKTLGASRYRSNTPLPITNPRVLEGFACSNGMTSFKSDNIPLWQTPIEEHINAVYNADGLSWLPAP